ncbi:hypothetical protein FRC03_001867 [Tulasnella sp. 419]|nr:hypothetical protein FRC03_001867 [Tulasnella sp. 419]
MLSATDVSSWPMLRRTAKPKTEENAFLGRLQMLAELRMVTMRAIDMYRRNKTADDSVLRYLFRYCDNALRMWIREESPQDENFFEKAMVLGYLILENHSDIPRVTNSGDSVPMKVARCITALKRWIDRHQASTEGKPNMDSKLHDSFSNSIIGSTLKYMRLVAKTIESDSRSTPKDELLEVDEGSISIGMRCLERSLRELATQEWPTTSLQDQLISALEVFPLINNDPATKILRLGSGLDLRLLMKQLKSRATSSSATTEDKAAAIRAACKLLNESSSPSKAWELDSNESPSLPKILCSFIEDKSIERRIFTLSTVIDTSILCPTTARSHEPVTSGHVGELPSTPQETRIDTVPYHHDPNTLYRKILEELRDPISETPTQLNKDLIEKTITFISALVDSVPNISLLSTSLEKQYMSPVAMIASHSDESLVSTATRQKAVSIVGHLLDSLYDKTSQNGSEEDMSTYTPYLKEVAKAIAILVDSHGSVDWKCINVWVNLLDKVSQNPLQVEMLHQSGLVEALTDAVPWIDFGEPDEVRRRRIFDQLTRPNKDLKEQKSESPLKEEISSLKFAKS